MRAGSTSAENPTKHGVRNAMLPAVLLAVFWLMVLAALSLWTANPVTVNRSQVLDSQYILTGRIVDPSNGIVEILELRPTRGKSFDRSLIKKKVALQPARVSWKKNSVRIFPVYRDKQGNWFVTPAPLPKFNYIDYPSTESIRNEIDRILTSRQK